MKSSRKIWMLLIAIITWFALGLQLYLMLNNRYAAGFNAIQTITNFFSYFTILSNCLVAIVLTVGLLSPGNNYFTGVKTLSAVALYIFIVGLVYNLVLRNLWHPTGWQLLADNLLHVMVPLLYVLYWGFYTG